ncbi:thiolase-like protein [Rhexocercosporidium sp. MPI-PUGE-AT-0058]|nr:thiolase-like protein [Rhexocercosporidium sp. MPI-PUGE-AT-0058]
MPAGFNMASARRYMEDRWGLGPGRQDAVLLCASTMQLESRFTNPEASKGFIDDIVGDYAKRTGIDIEIKTQNAYPTSNMVADALSTPHVVSTPSEHGRGQLLEQQAPGADSKLIRQLKNDAEVKQAATASLQEDLDALTREMGHRFLDGVRPIMSKRKARIYNSSWNWVLQDLYLLVNDVLLGKIQTTDISMRHRCSQMLNRATARFIHAVRHFCKTIAHIGLANLLQELLDNCEGRSSSLFTSPFRASEMMAPHTFIDKSGRVTTEEVERSANQYNYPREMRTKKANEWSLNEALTTTFERLRTQERSHSLSFKNKTVLVTGASRGSIAFDLVRGLLAGGAQVLVTTSRPSTEVYRQYQELYMSYGARDSELVVVPFNQGSRQDVESLVDYVCIDLGWELDHLVPFAAVAEEAEMDSLGAESELAHRLMLTNLIRLLGAVKKQKQAGAGHFSSGPAQVILPLSPNHGTFGKDGMYSESKIGLEMFMTKWYSESWAPYLSVCGAIIGWVRGTGLMARSEAFADGLEQRGVRTFTTAEMASQLLVLMSEPFAQLNENEPVYADLCGGLATLPDLRAAINDIRLENQQESDIALALKKESDKARANREYGDEINVSQVPKVSTHLPRLAKMGLSFPRLSEFKWARRSQEIPRGAVDLEKIVVITGMGEVGPFGSARTRWEMEATGEFSLEGCLELAWVMGLIKYHEGNLADGGYHIGWVDSRTGNPVHDSEIKAQYEQHILDHTGIRLVNADMDHGYDPNKKQFLHEIVLEADLPAFAASKDAAEQFRLEHGDKADIIEKDVNECYVSLLKGAVLKVPKALRFDRDIAGQVPSGWDARRYGIPEWLISQVDRITELYQYIHVSEVGNCIGSGAGGMQSLRSAYGHRHLDRDIPHDTLQETFINTMPAWINMLLMSASGPIRTPVGACATGVESLELGFETVVSGKAKFCLVGGVDDISEVTAFEFASMKATVSTDDEARRGRPSSESSRPMTSSRAGFVESQGAGVQVLTTARLALDMGLPIRAIVATVATASDKIGRSVPAPGKGLLANTHRVASALAVWHLNANHLEVASLHGTSTVANDINETTVLQQQLSHMGRHPGNPIMAVCQKYLTGHSKGGAGAWMVNGGLQILETGIVPGNRNADNIDSDLEFNHLVFFPNQAIHTTGVTALSVTSFGFGQKNAQAILVHPRYLLATLAEDEYECYRGKALIRAKKANRFFQKGIATNTLFSAKEKAPYEDAQEETFLLDVNARLQC